MQTIKQDINQYHHNEITPIIKQYQQHETQNTEHNPQTFQTSNSSNAEHGTRNKERDPQTFQTSNSSNAERRTRNAERRTRNSFISLSDSRQSHHPAWWYNTGIAFHSSASTCDRSPVQRSLLFVSRTNYSGYP